jgi:RNA ligase (TIGR02306 family)
MSKLIVEVCRVERVEPHPGADRLAIATVKGWKTVIKYDPATGRAEFAEGDRCVFFPPDAVLPPELANGPSDSPPGRLGCAKYLGGLGRDAEGRARPGGRVKAARLRGVPSYGLIMPLDPSRGDDPAWPVGADVAERFGVTKWEPPPERTDGDAEREHALFHRYTDIENFGNFPDAIPEGTEVVLTEKIHGKNCRVGCVLGLDAVPTAAAADGSAEGAATPAPAWTWAAGSHSVRRREFDAAGRRSEFWQALTEPVRRLIEHVRDELPWPEPKVSVLLFGEIFGSGVQDMAYGLEPGRRGFRAFDLAVNGRYLDFDVKAALLARFGVEAVPVLYRGPFSRKALEEFTSGPTTLCPAERAGKFRGREGVVITPVRETTARRLSGGRLILKSISADYLDRKGGTDGH